MIMYKTQNGISVTPVSRKQMLDIDKIAVEQTGPNLWQMMENAGRNLAELTIKALADKNKKQSILALAGSGNNGGGGLCAARHLDNHGYDVTVCISDPDKLKEVPAYQLKVLKSTGVKVIPINELDNQNPDLIIDALIGYSLNGEPRGKILELIKWANRRLSIKLSLDVPSGINSSSGEQSNNFIKPDLTLTLALPKIRLMPENTGELFLGDIGIPEKVFRKIGIDYISPFNKSYIVQLNPG